MSFPDPYYLAKFYRNDSGEILVRPHWSFSRWILDRVKDIPKSPSPDSTA